MTDLTNTKPNGQLEQMLLSHVDLCLDVSFALTSDVDNASDLTKEVMEWAWHYFDRKHSPPEIKKTLLIAIRNKYIEKYALPRNAPRRQAVLAPSV